MNTIEVRAKTVEEALAKGLQEMNVSLADVSYEVVDAGKKGLLGLIGSKQAVVRLTLKAEDEQAAVAMEKPAPISEKAEKAEKPVKAEKTEKSEKPEKKAEPKAQPKARKQQPAAAATDEAVKPEKAEKTEKTEKPEAPAVPKAEPSKAEDYPVDSAEYKALAFLQELTHLMGVDVDIYLNNDEPDTLHLNMFGDSRGILIGRRGETLDALQYLTSLNVNRGRDEYLRVSLDSENYRAKREEALRRLANRMANRAVKTGRKVVMEPMNPYERRILHSALQQNDAVTTHSEGEEPNRHVVITLKGNPKSADKK